MDFKVKTMAEMASNGEEPEVLFWVGCAGAFDERYKRVTRSFAHILNHLNINFAVLGNEESCTGDPARRAGNEFMFQMLAQQNIQVMNAYNVKRIVTACPHCFNIIKNEYPAMGGDYDVLHHSQFLQQLLDSGRLKVKGETYKNTRVTYHDPCFLGRGNDIYEAPRETIRSLKVDLFEMKFNKANGMCCGGGGAQVFKEPEKGDEEINVLRAEQALETKAEILALACPFCMIMLNDGVKAKDKEKELLVLDLAELIAADLPA